ncbi:MAG TPA: hypothetical protein VN747_10190 [Burkholderiales bacterium]|nr:hypothetical protein [Burkholderiales bacterium]
MFVMTEAAGGFLTHVLEEAHAAEDTAVRFVLEGEHIAPKLDTVHPGDDVFAHAGRKVLIVDKGVARVLGSSILDVEKTMSGSKLILMH